MGSPIQIWEIPLCNVNNWVEILPSTTGIGLFKMDRSSLRQIAVEARLRGRVQGHVKTPASKFAGFWLTLFIEIAYCISGGISLSLSLSA